MVIAGKSQLKKLALHKFFQKIGSALRHNIRQKSLPTFAPRPSDGSLICVDSKICANLVVGLAFASPLAETPIADSLHSSSLTPEPSSKSIVKPTIRQWAEKKLRGLLFSL